MDNFINSYLDNNGSKSSSTKTTFITSIKRLEKFLKTPFTEWNVNTFKNTKTIIDNLINDYSLNTIIQTVLLIIRYLEYKKSNIKLIQEYKDTLNELIQERNNNDNKQMLKNNEKENWIQYNELKKTVEDNAPEYINKKKSFSDFRNFLILSLFTLQPPTRIGNYLSMRYKNGGKRDAQSLNKKYNYITPIENGKWKMIFNNYKTSKYLGKIIHNIENPILNQLITKWFDEYNTNKKEFMVNVSGKPISQTNFTNAQKSISKKILGKELSTNLFRHIFLTYFLSTNPSIEEKQKVAQMVGQKYKVSRMELYERRNQEGDNITS
jgi:hypothetical protein